MLMLTIKKAYPKIAAGKGGTTYGISIKEDKEAERPFFRHADKPTATHPFLFLCFYVQYNTIF